MKKVTETKFIIVKQLFENNLVWSRDGSSGKDLLGVLVSKFLKTKTIKKEILLQMLQPIHKKLRIRNALLFHSVQLHGSIIFGS